MTVHFVYVRGPRGFVPQKWHQGLHDGAGKVSDLVAFSVTLSPLEEGLPIDRLVEIYPPPQKAIGED
jgi:hypothetical protein